MFLSGAKLAALMPLVLASASRALAGELLRRLRSEPLRMHPTRLGA